MKIFIDNKLVETDDESNVAISLSTGSVDNLNSGKTGYSKTILIPMTKNNREVMGEIEQINSPALFNSKMHTARIEVDGFTVIDGIASLSTICRSEKGGDYYAINIIGASKIWLQVASKTRFRDLEIPLSESLSPQLIKDSWEWDKPVSFFPVQRNRMEVVNADSNLFKPSKTLSFEDYHPFLHIGTVVEQIFRKAGYSVVSEFFNQEPFKSLYMSGNYLTSGYNATQTSMDFKAGRFNDVTVYANEEGVVSTRLEEEAYLGNIVDSADPNETQNGVSIEGVYDKSGCFKKINNEICFVPTSEINLGFELDLRYVCDYKMVNKNEIKTFNTVTLDNNVSHSFIIPNREIDRRKDIETNMSYKVIIFSLDNIEYWTINYKKETILNGIETWSQKTVSRITTKTYTLNVGSDRIKDLSITITRRDNWKTETLDEDKWAIYDGYVEDTGEIEVETTLRFSKEKITPSKPKYFNEISFRGASQGSKLTLKKGTTLRPIFSEYPYLGSNITFKNVASHDITCADLLKAIKHLFNLNFYTDNISKAVYIEPASMFYHKKHIIDWSDKLDTSKEIYVSECGSEMPQNITLQYASGDAAVSRNNIINSEKYGSWSAKITNTQSSDEETTYTNPIFTASLNNQNGNVDAPDAMLIHAGEVDGYSDDLNFPPKIVWYGGLKQLPQGQIWGWPENSNQYPLIVFHYEGANDYSEGDNVNPESTFSQDKSKLLENGISLCFNDRNNVAGLHRLYDRNIDLYNKSKRVEAYVKLEPQEIESITHPNKLGKDFRALYRLKIDGEHSLYRLEEIKEYRPASNDSTKCVFVKEVG